MVLTLDSTAPSILQDLPDINWSKIDTEHVSKKAGEQKLATKQTPLGVFAQVRIIILGRILARIDHGKTSSMNYQEAKASLLRTIYNDEVIMPRDEYHLQAIAEEWKIIQEWIVGGCSTSLPSPRSIS